VKIGEGAAIEAQCVWLRLRCVNVRSTQQRAGISRSHNLRYLCEYAPYLVQKKHMLTVGRAASRAVVMRQN
jgi:hypothetical protein